VQRIKQVYSECEGLSGDPFLECWDSKADEVRAIYQSLEAQNGNLSFGPLEAFAEAAINLTNISAIGDLVQVGSGALQGTSAALLSASSRTDCCPSFRQFSMGCSGPSSTWWKPLC
jgi:hypothetical protein